MNLVDSCAWLEYFSNGKNADFFAAPLEDVENLLVPSICILEVFKKILQEKDEHSAFQGVALMKQGYVTELNMTLAILSAKLSYDFKIPLADSIILATARQCNAIIWTQDKHFKNMIDVKYIEKKSKNS